MGKTKEAFAVWKRVFKKRKYVFILLAVAFVFYLLNGFIINIPNIKTSYSLFGFFGAIKFIFALSLRFVYSISLFGAIGTIILSLLLGVFISLLAYRFSTIQKSEKGRGGFLGSFGLFLGMAAPGCAACGVGLLSLLGLTSILVILPFNGHEVIVIAIGFVSFSIFNISGKLYNPECRVNLNPNKKDERG